MPYGTLYLVPTPIGNLEDITLRALRILKEVDSITCEDTRQTIKLLNHFGIKKPLLSFYTYNQGRRIPGIISDLQAGKNIALVSDSGTPGISDPGFFLIAEAVKSGISIVPLPGPNAAITALVASGLPTDGFIFLGFLKKKPGKMKKELLSAARAGKTIVFYESPHRIKKTMELCAEVFSGGTRACLGRELTKKFEEFARGTLDEINKSLAACEPRGEFVVMISVEDIDNEQEDEQDE